MDTKTVDLDFTPERVKRIRVLLGLSQQDFADKLGINVNMVTRYETGKAEPMRGPVLKALLDAEGEVNSAAGD